MAEPIPLAQQAYDKTNEQRTRTIIEQRLGDIEKALYNLRTTYGTIGLGESTFETLSAGANNNVAPGYTTFMRITEPTGGAFSISGFSGGERGRLLVIANLTGQNMTLSHEGGSSDAANRIQTPTGADMATTGNGAAVLIYDGTSSRWRVIAMEV